jgi:alkylation response protein AidB-like acyl-CoA dehydrogenase
MTVAPPEPVLPLVESQEHQLLRQSVAGVAASFGHDYFTACKRERKPPRELWNALAGGGFLGVNIPAEFGGGGLGLYELAMVQEEVSAQGCPLLPILTSPATVGTILKLHGTPEQQERWLPGLGSGHAHYSLAVTEPDAGSNTHRIRTTATRADGGWRLNGSKYYISGLEDAQAVLVLARTGQGSGGRGEISMFLLDIDTPGFTREAIPTVIEAPEDTYTVFFDDVEVGDDRVIGGVGAGLAVAFDGLNPERILSAALCNGVSRYALGKAAAYANERVVWDRPIGEHQGVAHPLAECKIALEASRLMTSKAALLQDAGAPAGEASNMAKLMGADTGLRCLDQAIQTHGGNGLAREYGLADLWFIVRLQRIAPVSREMILNYIARHSLGLPRSY